MPNCRRIALLCKQYGVSVVVDSDAHYHASVGEVEPCLRMLEEIDFPPELIVNGDRERLRPVPAGARRKMVRRLFV